MDSWQDEIEATHDAFLLDPGMGPMLYLTADGRLLEDSRGWDGDAVVELTGDRANAALVVGARKTGISDLLDLIPPRPLAAHVPNRIPLKTRLRNTLGSLFLIAYGGYGLWTDDLYIPGKRRGGIHLHGVPAIVMFLAILAAAAALMCAVVDHYDRRNNEHRYAAFADVAFVIAFALFFLSILVGLVLLMASAF